MPTTTISTRLRRAPSAALRSPCAYLVAAAVLGYGIFATLEYERHGTQVGAVDLGIFYQAVQGWAFHADPYVAIKGFSQLGDHFSPAWALLAPLLWIHDSPYTLVLAQVVLLALSGIPVYRAVRRMWGPGPWRAAGVTASYLASSGIQHAIAFPVHEVMFATPIIAWALERMLAGRWTAATALMCSLCLVKEDLNLMTAAFAILALLSRKWRHAAFLAIWGVALYLITVKFLIPEFSPQGYTYLSQYSSTLHASNSFQLFLHIIEHPHTTIHLLIGNHTKRELWYILFAPVACLALASPITLLAVPELLSRLLSSDTALWSSNYHYDAPLMPIIFLGAVDALPRLGKLVALYVDEPRTAQILRWASTGFVAITLAMTLNLAHRLPLGIWLRKPSTYEASAQWNHDARTAIAAVPSDVTVETTNRLAVLLLTRDTVTITSDRPTGTWAVLDLTAMGGGSSSDADADADARTVPYVAELLHSNWRLIRQDGSIVVLHHEPAVATRSPLA
ncbi:MAG TPA: DUF2079 domain-containing protein [Actinospica sp.]|nr:DUF2079 domain-containing protein [Actinospica sp.]